MPGIASSAPAVLLAHLASLTERIRLGSGGVMLPNHAPLVIAEQFGMLEALHPGRIDLGIGRAPGTDPRTAAALRRTQSLQEPDLPEQLGELYGFFNGTFPEDHPYRGITAVPARGNQPAIWLLGSSDYSARLAGLLGLPFSFAHHFSAGQHAARPRGVPAQLPTVGRARRAVRDARRGGPLRRRLTSGRPTSADPATSRSSGCARVARVRSRPPRRPPPSTRRRTRRSSSARGLSSRIVGDPEEVGARPRRPARAHRCRRAHGDDDGPRPRTTGCARTGCWPSWPGLDRRPTPGAPFGHTDRVPEGDTLFKTAARLRPALQGHAPHPLRGPSPAGRRADGSGSGSSSSRPAASTCSSTSRAGSCCAPTCA